LVLGLDTSTERSCVALARGSESLAGVALEPDRHRGETLADSTRDLLATAGVTAAALQGIAVVVGPGSYTGLRVGLAMARGLALVDRLPVVGLGSLELLALAADGSDAGDRRAALLPAGRGRVFVAAFYSKTGGVEEIAAPRVADAAELGAVLGAGPYAGASLCVDAETVDQLGRSWLDAAAQRVIVVPSHRADVLARVGAARIADGAGVEAERVLPLYVGGSSARPNRNRVASLGSAAK